MEMYTAIPISWRIADAALPEKRSLLAAANGKTTVVTIVLSRSKRRVLIFPKGNNVDHLSMYLDVMDSGNLPYGWSRLYIICQQLRMTCHLGVSFSPAEPFFYKLQYSDNSVATKELTKSFGWDTYDSFMQHDVQELNRVLCEKLEDKMKGTVVEGTIEQLFEGHHINYIECINVDYKSSRKESFYDLQLDVKGCRDVYASFDKYVEVERLEGCKERCALPRFPPVLQLQLKRFEYDYMRDTMVKRQWKISFSRCKSSIRNLYTLHSVLVHSGGVHGGHYYAFIRPTLSDQWYKFDDERVTKEDIKRHLKSSMAVRKSDKEKIMCNVDEKDIAEHLRIRLKKEQEEKEHKKKEKAEAHLYTVIKIARDEDLKEQIGKNIYFDLVDHEKVRSFRIQKQLPFTSFKEEVAKEFGIPVQFQRFWLWAKRQNHTYRPNRPLTPHEEAQSVGQLREVSNKAHNAELKLFLEVELGPELCPIRPSEKSKEDILLFFKLYNAEKEELRFVGRLFVKALGKPSEILTKLNEMAGFSPNEEIELYEEIKFEPNVMCEHIDKKLTFRSSQLEDGDIICFQKAPVPDGDTQVRYPDVPSFLEYVHNRQTSDILYYEVLDIPLPELQCLKTLKVAFHHATKGEVVIHSIRLPRNSTISDVITDLKTKVELSNPDAELRLLEVFYHKIYKIFPPHEKIENINDQYWTLRAEEIPEEEKNLGPHDRLIHVYHFMKDPNQNQQIQNFGDPFLMVIREGETAAEVMERIQRKLRVPDEFSKWKLAFISMNRPEYLQDTDVVSARFQRRDVYGAWEQYLGLEHTDTTSKRSYTANQNRHTYEKPVKIYN
ncbi:unnamed protein product [Miscanthus lutarioriparius]|uniref:ubiquitinyl hydrolase 1 n=1 Tax=Miscanthus lutarioriparius TaxID=422564 RepID=A0A811RI75_9POAL|nr:unnamed protein product [Miscanthus lutarioriparius]